MGMHRFDVMCSLTSADSLRSIEINRIKTQLLRKLSVKFVTS